MARRFTLQRFMRIHNQKEESNDPMYSTHYDWAAHFIKKNPKKSVSYLNECYETNPLDADVLHMRSVCKRKLARIESALEDALEAGKIKKKNPSISLEICDGLYDLNEFEKCKIELHDDTRKYPGAVVKDFKDRILVVNENFQDCLGDSLRSFFCKNRKILSGIAEDIHLKSLVDTRPIWKIRKDNGECDVISVAEKHEKLLSPLELARKKRSHRIFSQIYLEKSWVDENFICELLKKDEWQVEASASSTPYLTKLLKSQCTTVNKFMRMLHARSPLYNEYIKRFGDQKFFKRNQTQYLCKKQLQTRRKMFTILGTIKQLRKLGKIEEMTKYIEEMMKEVALKTSRIIPWKFEFINEVYNTIGLAHADRYILPRNTSAESLKINNLKTLLKISKPEELYPASYEFGNRSTYVPVNAVDPKLLKQKEMLSILGERLNFAKYSIEKCYLYYEMARTYIKNNRFNECLSMAKMAIEESKNCNSQLWAFLSTMLIVKTYAHLGKIEYCHDALLDALNIGTKLKDPAIKSYLQYAIALSSEGILMKFSSLHSESRRKLSKRNSSQSLRAKNITDSLLIL